MLVDRGAEPAGGRDGGAALGLAAAEQQLDVLRPAEVHVLAQQSLEERASVDVVVEDQPVPGDVFDAYREVAPLDPGFADRRELWRLPTCLAVITVGGLSLFGRQCLTRLAGAVRRYR